MMTEPNMRRKAWVIRKAIDFAIVWMMLIVAGWMFYEPLMLWMRGVS